MTDERWSGWVSLVVLCVLCTACGSESRTTQGTLEDPTSGILVAGSEVRFPATVDVGSFERKLLGMPGYHLIVWNDGGASNAALFRTAVSDLEVLEALESLGAEPGDALGNAAWDRRNDPEAVEPDQVIEGPKVNISILVPGRDSPLRLEDFLEDPGGRGFDMRFGGHRANREAWGSGCVACLYSCPGSKVGNARYTIRDYVDKRTRFGVIPNTLPPDGTRVVVVLGLEPAEAGR